MLSLPSGGRIHRRHLFALCKDKGFMTVTFCTFWGVLGASLISWKDTFGLAWFVCRQKTQEGLESRILMHLLGGLEDKE